LGRLARHIGFAGLLVVVSVGAAGAPAAASDPTLFRLTISGVAHHEWSHTSAPVESDGCRRTELSEGVRTTRFATSRPVLVHLSRGRVLPANVRGIAATVTLNGATTTNETCGGQTTSKIADCVRTRRAVKAARVHVWSPARGLLAVGHATNVRLRVAGCPKEPADVRARPFGPALTPLKLPALALTATPIARISLRASRTGNSRYDAPEQGSLRERVEYTITLVRAS
jgi:hypothetical protein